MRKNLALIELTRAEVFVSLRMEVDLLATRSQVSASTVKNAHFEDKQAIVLLFLGLLSELALSQLLILETAGDKVLKRPDFWNDAIVERIIIIHVFPLLLFLLFGI